MKNIFSRLLVIYFVMILLVIFILTSVISFMYKNIIIEEKKESFNAIAKKTNIVTENYVRGDITHNELNAEINGMSYSSDVMIYVIEVDKEALEQEKILDYQGINDDFVYDDLSVIVNGKKVFRKNEYSKKFETYVAYMGYPLNINNEIKGAILMFCPINNINKNIMEMNRILWMVSVIIFFLSIPLIMFCSHKISKPIKKIEKAARAIAKGENTELVVVNAKDEIGMLAHSFNNMREQLEINEKVKREFIANVSHELRTPLTSIGGFVQGMIDGIIPMEQSNEYLKIIQDETKRLSKLSSELLDITKMQSGVVELKIEDIYLYSTIEEAILLIKEKAEVKEISIKTYANHNIMVSMDKERLLQIFINLLNNAIKYTEQGGKIVISAKQEKHLVEVFVKDTGIGIEEEELPFVFDKFYRTNKKHNTGEENSGLGLAIVKNLIVLSGGNINIESKPDKGTCIRFTLNKAEGNGVL